MKIKKHTLICGIDGIGRHSGLVRCPVALVRAALTLNTKNPLVATPYQFKSGIPHQPKGSSFSPKEAIKDT